MSLSKAIKFRYLASQLTHSELLQFVHKLLNYSHDIIIAALFSHFVQLAAKRNVQLTDSVNILLCNMILSRKKTSKPTTITITTQTRKLDRLPRPLIGVTASFLNQFEYINLSKVNRSIYLGCNSPNSLQKVDITKIKSYSSIDLSTYKSAADLKMNINKIKDLVVPISDLSLNRLQSVTLDADRKNDCDINCISTTKLESVRKLNCLRFGVRGHLFAAYTFSKLLTTFPNIQYLQLRTVCCDMDMDKMKTLYPDLKGLQLMLRKDTINSLLINRFGNKLDFLSFCQLTKDDYNLCTVNFNKLKELKLFTPTIKSINDILSTSINLEKLSIESTIRNIGFMQEKETKDLILTAITKCKYLQYIEFVDDGKLIISVLESIEKGLFQTKKRKRKEFKIQIVIHCDQQFKPQHLMLYILNIINWLLTSEINDFMFILALKNLNKNIDQNVVMIELKEILCNINVKRFGSIFVITNKHCHINGYKTKWRM